MNITYYGHSCFCAEINGNKLLFDPFITGNPLASEIDVTALKPDFILISHGHNDHIGDTVQIAKQSGATVVCSYEVGNWLAAKGVEKTMGMNVGGKVRFDFGHVKCVIAQHSSALPDGTYGGHPMGFVIESSAGNFYYAGDTALTYDMRLIGDYRKIDFAFLPIGDVFTMGTDNAIIACDFIRCNNIIGMHYDTFPPIKINHEEALAKFIRAGKKLTLMNIGETRNIELNTKKAKEWEK